MAENKEKKKKFNWFGRYNLDGKGVDKGEPDFMAKPTFGNFFVLVGRKWNRLITVNLMMVFGNFPIFFYFIYRAGYFGITTSAPYHQQFVPLYGAAMFEHSPVVSALYGVFGIQVPTTVNTPLTLVFLWLTALLLVTFGPVNAGVTYIMRGMMRGEPVFLWSDFWHAVKKNYKQALPMGAIDLLALFLLGNDVIFFWGNLTSFWMYMMFYISIIMFLIYFMMRFYIYHIMITFDLSARKIYKNSLIFTLLGIKRNLMGLIGCAIVLALNYFIFGTYIPVGIVLPFVITPALMMLIETYVAFPKIKEYMIDPYYGAGSDGVDGSAEADGPAADVSEG